MTGNFKSKARRIPRDKPKDIKDTEIGFNKAGWYCLRHKDGWYVGHAEGILCYKDHGFARVALTILWQRDGGGAVCYKIETYQGEPLVEAGEHSFKLSAVAAIRNYEEGTGS